MSLFVGCLLISMHKFSELFRPAVKLQQLIKGEVNYKVYVFVIIIVFLFVYRSVEHAVLVVSFRLSKVLIFTWIHKKTHFFWTLVSLGKIPDCKCYSRTPLVLF